jgi:DNA-binding response OmpR family regulator
MAIKTILIIEDDAPLRDDLQLYLTARGFHILQAGNVDEAVAILQKETPDLILLDLLLPGKHGTVLLETLKEVGSNIPVIVITNTDSVSRRDLCMRLGASDFVIKSNTPLKELTKLIVKYCDSTGR